MHAVRLGTAQALPCPLNEQSHFPTSVQIGDPTQRPTRLTRGHGKPPETHTWKPQPHKTANEVSGQRHFITRARAQLTVSEWVIRRRHYVRVGSGEER